MRVGETTSVVACVLLSLSVQEARSTDSPYFPLQQGWGWEYAGDDGDIALAWIDGTQVVQGLETTVLHWHYSGEIEEHLYQYYTTSDDGSVLIHGFWSPSAGLTRSFSPPIVLLPSSLSLDLEWCSTFQEYEDLEGTIPVGDPSQVCFRVYSIDQLSLPAGDFTAFGVGQFLPGRLAPPERDILGRRPGSTAYRDATDWYAVGVGKVAFSIYQHFELASWTQPPTPTRSMTWGRIKTTFTPN